MFQQSFTPISPDETDTFPIMETQQSEMKKRKIKYIKRQSIRSTEDLSEGEVVSVSVSVPVEYNITIATVAVRLSPVYYENQNIQSSLFGQQ